MNFTPRLTGRPPKDPKQLVSTPVRCLVTKGVWIALEKAGRLHGTNPSDTLRLAIYRLLEQDGLLNGLDDDATWYELKRARLV